jgi:hypothetical protein
MLLHNRRRTAGTYNNLNSGKRETNSAYHQPMWRVDGPRHDCALVKKAKLEKAETVEFFANTSNATLSVNGKYHTPGAKIELAPGEYTVEVSGFKDGGFPCFYCEGETFATDESWNVADFDKRGVRAGCNDYYTSPADNPEIFKFSYKRVDPVSIQQVEGGTLYDFGKESFGKLVLFNVKPENAKIFISLGETVEEAMDTEMSVIVHNAEAINGSAVCDSSALRYAFVPDQNVSFKMYLDFEYLDIEDAATFKCDNEKINKLWDICAYTLHLNMREAFSTASSVTDGYGVAMHTRATL